MSSSCARNTRCRHFAGLANRLKVIFHWICTSCACSQHATHVAVTLCGMTCIHTSFPRSPRGHGSVTMDKMHCRQWMSSLFCGFLPNPFIQDLFLWRTSQEFVKTDLYPLSLMSLWYAVWNVNEWGVYLVVRTSFHWPKQILMGINFSWIFTENNPARGTGKNMNWLI